MFTIEPVKDYRSAAEVLGTTPADLIELVETMKVKDLLFRGNLLTYPIPPGYWYSADRIFSLDANSPFFHQTENNPSGYDPVVFPSAFIASRKVLFKLDGGIGSSQELRRCGRIYQVEPITHPNIHSSSALYPVTNPDCMHSIIVTSSKGKTIVEARDEANKNFYRALKRLLELFLS